MNFKSIGSRPFRGYRIKLNLLILAILLWVFVVTGREYEILIPIPLNFVNIMADKVLVSDVPAEVMVQFKGTGRSLIALQTFNYAEIELDLSTINNFYDFQLSPKYVKINAPLQVEALEVIHPETLYVRLDDLLEKELPILPDVKVETKPGYVLVGDARVSPGTVKVTGPKSVLNGMDTITTVAREFTELKKSVKERIPLSSPGRKLSAEFGEVIINIKVERLLERRFRQIPIEVRNPPSRLGVHLEPDNVSVKVSGAVSIVKNLTSDEIAAYIEFPSRWNEDITGMMPNITLPNGVELVEFEPDTVLMTLTESGP